MEQNSTQKPLLAYQRKRIKRGKNRHVRLADVAAPFNLLQADHDARKGKKAHKGVRIFDQKPAENLSQLSSDLINHTYHTSPGHDTFRDCPCGKRRKLHKLPYFPDHITHHALMLRLMPILTRAYFYDSSASIKGKGIHFAERRIQRYISENRDAGQLYYGKLDFVKFYERIDQQKMFACLARKFTDTGIRYLIHEVVTACEQGLGIGLYPIQPFANYYMCALCREVSRLYRVRVFIHCDDISIISRDKKEVWRAINYVKRYAEEVLCQPLHENIGVQVINHDYALDMVGYQFFIDRTLIRKRMKNRFKRKMHNLKDPFRYYRVAMSYKGWLMNCNGFNLWCKTTGMKSFSEMKVPTFEKRDADGRRILEGTKTSASMLTDREVIFTDAEFDVKSKYKKIAAVVQVEDNGKKYKFFTCNQKLIEALRYVNTHDGFPFRGTLYQTNATGLPDYMIK